MHKKVMAQAVALVLTGLVASAAIAADSKQAPPVATASGSMQVAFFDPITKQLRAPTAEEAAAFAKSVELNRQQQALLPNTSGRPRDEAESLKTQRQLRVNGIEMVAVDTPESEMNYVVGKRDANGNLVVVHPGDNVETAAKTEVTQ